MNGDVPVDDLLAGPLSPPVKVSIDVVDHLEQCLQNLPPIIKVCILKSVCVHVLITLRLSALKMLMRETELLRRCIEANKQGLDLGVILTALSTWQPPSSQYYKAFYH